MQPILTSGVGAVATTVTQRPSRSDGGVSVPPVRTSGASPVPASVSVSFHGGGGGVAGSGAVGDRPEAELRRVHEEHARRPGIRLDMLAAQLAVEQRLLEAELDGARIPFVEAGEGRALLPGVAIAEAVTGSAVVLRQPDEVGLRDGLALRACG